MEAKKLKNEIERRTRDTAKLIELETQKLAVGEMVLERLDSILELLHAAGFKVAKLQQPAPQPAAVRQDIPPPPNTVVVQASQLAPEQPKAVKNPCVSCGQEAAFDEPMPDGTKKFYCRTHGQQRIKEKAEEQQTAALMGTTGTMFARAKNPNAPPPQKIIYQTDPVDPLKGPFPNGPPPPNNVLGDD